MYKKKIAIYVEGQTEQIFINQLIKIWWNYTGIEIQNLRLRSYQNIFCKVSDFKSGLSSEQTILFLLIDVDGVGSLTSAIANNATSQLQKGFEIIGLRDLSAEDFDQLPVNINRMGSIIQNFKEALKTKCCEGIEKIDLFLAIMTIEAWMLAFTASVAKWAKISEIKLLETLDGKKLEEIKTPSSFFRKLGKFANKRDPKSFKEISSFTSHINVNEIKQVYEHKRVPNFNRFWDRIISLDIFRSLVSL